MRSISEFTKRVEPIKSFYATLYDVHGVLCKLDGTIYFMASESGDITEYEPEMAPWTCILGEIGLSETQAMMDEIHGGCARIACDRLREVA